LSDDYATKLGWVYETTPIKFEFHFTVIGIGVIVIALTGIAIIFIAFNLLQLTHCIFIAGSEICDLGLVRIVMTIRIFPKVDE
jgi:energy-converting hydrogenase Eha subunit E